jgi:hypothetical protein
MQHLEEEKLQEELNSKSSNQSGVESKRPVKPTP